MRFESSCGEVSRGLERLSRKGRRGEEGERKGHQSGMVLTRVGTRACITSRLDQSILLMNQKYFAPLTINY